MGFVPVCRVGEVPDGQARRFLVAGLEVVIFNCQGEHFANDGTCTHALAGLEGGSVDCVGRTVKCPLHGARFDLGTGEALTPPAALPVTVFPVRTENGWLLAGLPD